MFFIEDGNQTKYMVKYECLGERYKVVVTDLVNIWMEEISSGDMICRCMDLNPNIEAPPENLLSRVINLIDSLNSGAKADISFNEGKLYLSLETRLSGFLFRFKFELSVADQTIFMEEVTYPLMWMVKELQARVTQLYGLLKSKDTEIQQYKLEGAQICRKSVETEPFRKEDFEKQYFTKNNDHAKECLINMMNLDIIQLWGSVAVHYTAKSDKSYAQIKQELDLKIKAEPVSSDESVAREDDYTSANNETLTVKPKAEPALKLERDTVSNHSHNVEKQKKLLKRKFRL